MAFKTPNMSLTVYNSPDDHYDHEQVADNFLRLDQHDHSDGKGRPIPTSGIEDGAITHPKLAAGAVGPGNLAPGSVTAAAFGDDSVSTRAIQNRAVTEPKLADESVSNRTIVPKAVTTGKIADHAVQNLQLDDAVVPIGTKISWWRPSIAHNPSWLAAGTWVVCDGSSLTSSQHDFGGGGTIVLPNLLDKYDYHVSLDRVGEVGGANSRDLRHTHTVFGHTHGISDHTHGFTVAAHAHGLFGKFRRPISDPSSSIEHSYANAYVDTNGVNYGGSSGAGYSNSLNVVSPPTNNVQSQSTYNRDFREHYHVSNMSITYTVPGPNPDLAIHITKYSDFAGDTLSTFANNPATQSAAAFTSTTTGTALNITQANADAQSGNGSGSGIISSATDLRPAYVGMLPLMKVKNS